MLTSILIPFRVVINFSWGLITTAIIGVSIISIGIFKVLLPFKTPQRICSFLGNALFRVWAYCMSMMFQLTQRMEWHIKGDLDIHEKGWYMVMANHRSWVDVLVLMHLTRRHMPMPRFFLKSQLMWIPIIGWGCWVLDMPFMKRYSKELLEKKPHLKGKDITTTTRSCAKFRHIPTTVVNFCEGTRFTPEKHAKKQSPFRNLLPPKAGGTAFSLQIMGGQFEAILDITIVYPGTYKRPVVWHLLSGQLKNVYVDIKTRPITEDLIGDYASDEAFRAHFQQWLNQRWQEKDQTIDEMRKEIHSTR
ncbi:acyltransferase [Idiomarina sp. M1R2S28]|uniref:Acyltransferase n=1 Tax=Idiomarina rhizosphaerae TaxID=2961572 RepID=A0A9X2G134_9GAMM|nr:acyltransferase [Idiomarina rhizosphaerae]MCP1338438.1 acyltransferase [Idiomarina rhizosphaerae]